MSRKPYLKYILVFGILSVAVAVIAVMAPRRTPAPGAAATAEKTTRPETPPAPEADDEPEKDQPTREQPAEDQPAFETFAPDDDDLDYALELSEIIDNREDDFEARERERLEKARKELRVKLSERSGGRTALLEGFLDEFGIGIETHQYATTLAEFYYHAERLDDARRVYHELIASLPEKDYLYLKQFVTMQMAQMEGIVGDLAVAEELLLGIIETPIPEHFAQNSPAFRQIVQVQKEIDAPLLLAGVYKQAGRFEEASRTLDAVISTAMALPEDHDGYGNVPWHVGRAYSSRIELLLAQAQPDKVDEATDAAFELIGDYEETLAGLKWPNSERTMNYIGGYKDSLRMLTLNTACRAKIEDLFESAGSLDEAVAAANRLVEEYRSLGNEHVWHKQHWADAFQRSMDGMKAWASRAAEKKRSEP